MDHNNWNEKELQCEFNHIYETRIGILCGDKEPTADQMAIAISEADKACEKLKQQKES